MRSYNRVLKYLIFSFGDVAQLVERLLRMQEVSGSNPLISTNILRNSLVEV